jgi:hypothetical protein
MAVPRAATLWCSGRLWMLDCEVWCGEGDGAGPL